MMQMNDEFDDVPEQEPIEPVTEPVVEPVEEIVEAAEEAPSGYVDFDNWDNLTDEQRGALKGRVDQLTRDARFAQRDLDHLKTSLGGELNRIKDRTSNLEEAEFGDRMEELRAKKVTALEEYDFETAAKIDEALMEVKLSQRQMPQPEPVPEASHAQVEATPELQQFVSQWGNELDGGGQPVRPWANPHHHDHQSAVQEATKLSQDPIFMADVYTADNPTTAFLSKFDKTYRGRSRSQEVLSGATNASPQMRAGEVKLTAAEKRTASLMNLSEADYAESLKEIRGA